MLIIKMKITMPYIKSVLNAPALYNKYIHKSHTFQIQYQWQIFYSKAQIAGEMNSALKKNKEKNAISKK